MGQNRAYLSRAKEKNRKGKCDRYVRRIHNSPSGSEDDGTSSSDCSSVSGDYSECSSSNKEYNGENGEINNTEEYEEKLKSILDASVQNSSQARTNHMNAICKHLVRKYVPNFVKENQFTISEIISKSLKGSSKTEVIAAAHLACLIVLQLELGETGDVIDKELRNVVAKIARDPSASPAVRTKCCSTLALMGFLSVDDELGETIQQMKHLQSIYSKSINATSDQASNCDIPNDIAELHAAAINAWSLLLTGISSRNIVDMINSKTFPSLEQFARLLQSPHLDVRLAGGEAIALLFEQIRIEIPDFAKDFAANVITTFDDLATDSSKHRKKKDKKEQRATFRDILQYFQNNYVPEIVVTFRDSEELELNTWNKRRQYEAICPILGPGINSHLKENCLLREIFDLPPPLEEQKLSHFERQQQKVIQKRIWAVKAKHNCKVRNRDKRSDFYGGGEMV